MRAAVDLLLGRGFEPGNIGIHGGSYGAATGLLAAAAIPEIGAVVADSAFADMRDIMERQIKERTGVPSQFARLLRPGITVLAWLLYSLDLGAISPERAVPDIAPRPILFIHGDEDRTIPVEHALRLKAASQIPADELWILRGLGHTEGVRRHADDRFGSRLCENAGGDTCRATLESKTRPKRFIVAARDFFLNQCFVSAAEK